MSGKNLRIFIAVFAIFFGLNIFAASPSQPILPSDNIQDPGSPSTPWGGCTPSDANCYVTLTSFTNETVTGLDYSTSTGVLSLTSGYTIPTVASTTAWNTALAASSNAALQNGNSFGTTLTLGTNDNQNINFETNGLAVMTVSTDGKVGVGTASPLGKLQVEGGSIYANAPQSDAVINGGAGNAWQTYANLVGSAGLWAIRTATNGSINFDTNNSFSPITALTILTGGNVGIGSSTPSSKLVVAGNTNITGSLTLGTALADGQFIKSGDWTGLFDGQEGTYYLNRANQTGTQLAVTISDFATTSKNLFSSSATGLTYSTTTGIFSLTSGYVIPTTASTTEWANKVSSQWTSTGSNIFYTTGNVGIGTSTPASKLDVWGNLSVGTSSASALFVNTATGFVGINNANPAVALDVSGIIRGNAGSNDIKLQDGAGNSAFRSVRAGGWVDGALAQFFQVGNSADNIVFSALNATNMARLLYLSSKTQFTAGARLSTPLPVGIFEIINSSNLQILTALDNGNIGIGTSTPSSALEVAGNITLSSGGGKTITTPGNTLTLSQTGGVSGQTSTLKILGTNTTVGAQFETNTSLVDFSFLASGSGKPASNIRYDTRLGIVNSANNAYGEFSFYMNPAGYPGGDVKAFYSGAGQSGVQTGNFFVHSGNLGVGTTTSSANLAVVGSTTSATSPVLQITNTASGAFVPSFSILAPNLAAGQATYMNFGQSQSTNNSGSILYTYVGNGSVNNRLGFNFYGGSEALSILANGNVGIGTTTPGTALTLGGSGQFSGPGGSQTATTYSFNGRSGNGLYSSNDTTVSVAVAGSEKLRVTNGYVLFSNADMIIGASNSIQWDLKSGIIYQPTSGILGMYNTTSGLEKFRFDTGNGYLGVGTTTAAEALVVAGNINLTGALKANGNAGTSGQLLQSTATGVQWVSTSTLGISQNLNALGTAVTVGNGNTNTAATSSVFGVSNSALATNSVLLGQYNFSLAAATGTVAIGILNNSSGAAYNTSTGVITGAAVATSTIGIASTAVGIGNVVRGDRSTAVGLQNVLTVNGSNASAFGYANIVTGGSNLAAGYGNTTAQNYSSGVGYSNNASGNVGQAFGYSNIASNNQSSAFGVSNTAAGISSSAFGWTNNVTSAGALSAAFGYNNTVSGAGSFAFGGSINNSVDGSLVLGPSNSAKLTILSTGAMGIGSTTPSATLAVTGISGTTDAFAVASSTNSNMFIVKANGNVGIGTTTVSAMLQVYGGSNLLDIGRNVGVDDTDTNQLTIRTRSYAGNSVFRVLDRNGTVSIKMTDQGKLYTGNYSGTLGNTYAAGFGGTVDINGDQAGFQISDRIDFTDKIQFYTTGNIFRIYNVFDGFASEPFVMNQATGYIGMGTSSPADRLQVFGDIRIGTTGTNGCLKNFAGTGLIGSCSSDERLKTNIVDLSDGYLDKMNNLKVISYKWNDTAKELNKVDTSVTNYGLLAQNVEEYFPELVTIDSKGYRQVDYSRIPLYLLKSVQELSKKVDSIMVWFKDGKLNVQDNVCVDDYCVTKAQFKQILINGQNGQSSGGGSSYTPPVVTPDPEPTPDPVVDEPAPEPTPEPVAETPPVETPPSE